MFYVLWPFSRQHSKTVRNKPHEFLSLNVIVDKSPSIFGSIFHRSPLTILSGNFNWSIHSPQGLLSPTIVHLGYCVITWCISEGVTHCFVGINWYADMFLSPGCRREMFLGTAFRFHGGRVLHIALCIFVGVLIKRIYVSSTYHLNLFYSIHFNKQAISITANRECLLENLG